MRIKAFSCVFVDAFVYRTAIEKLREPFFPSYLGFFWGEPATLGFELLSKYFVISLQEFPAVFRYGIYFSRSSALLLFLACEKASFFQAV
jgi:hypothetical protein